MSEQTPPAAGTPQKGVLFTIFLTVFIDLIGFSIIFPLFPAMLEYYRAKEETGGLFHALIGFLSSFSGDEKPIYLIVLFGGVLGSLYSTLQFLCAPLWGSLSDRTGRRPVLLVTITGIAVSYLLWFVSGSFALLVGARLLGGIASGNIAVATAAVADATTPQNRAKGMALVGIAFGLGFTLGPAIGGALSLVDLSALAPGLKPWGVNPFSAAAGGALLLSIANLFWVARRFPETLTSEKRGTSRRHRTANLAKLFGPQEFAGVHRANIVYFIFFLAFSGMEFTLVFLAFERFAYEPVDNAWMFVFVGLLMALVQGGVVRRVVTRVGEKNLVLAGLALLLPGFVVTGLASTPGMLYGGLAFLAAGGAMATPCLSALVSLYTPADRQGEILGVFRSLGALARAIGPILACVLYWQFGSESPYLAGAVVLLIPLGVAFGLPQPREGSAVSSSPDSAA